MRQITVYKYPELTDTAKDKARQWWIDLEREFPAWMDEHRESMIKAIDLVKEERNIKRLISLSEKCELTGYCADYILSELIKDINKIPTKEEIQLRYATEWDKELYERVNDRQQIEEAITANEYEFLEDGRKL